MRDEYKQKEILKAHETVLFNKAEDHQTAARELSSSAIGSLHSGQKETGDAQPLISLIQTIELFNFPALI